MHPLDYLVIGFYLVAIVLLGAWFGRRQTRHEFFAASGSMGWLAVGLSVMATLFSSNSFVFYPAAAIGNSLRIGLSLIAFSLMTPLIVFVFIPVFARSRVETAYEYLERRFDVSVRLLASGLFILLRIGWMASATYAASIVVASVAGIPQLTVIIGLGSVAIAYTMMGGLRAVMWTDVIQFFVFALTILGSLALVIDRTGLDVVEITDRYFDGREGVLVDFSPSMTLSYGSWAILIGVFLEALSAFGADQVAVQRYLAARNERVSRIGAWINLLGMWIVIPGLLGVGVALHAFYERNPEELAGITTVFIDGTEGLQAVLQEDPSLADRALPAFVGKEFPPGLAGLFLAALMAAIMSSIDSGIHSVTTAVVVDFRDRLWPGKRTDNEQSEIRFIRMLVLLIGFLSVGLACFVGPLGNVFDIGKKLTSAFGGPLLAIFILAFFCRRATTGGVLAAVLLSTGITLGLMYEMTDWFSVWFWPIGFGLSLVLGYLLSIPGRAAADPLTWARVVGRNEIASHAKGREKS